ncbi:MAG: hypothetical protein KKF43_12920 [Proteobacteria bacterium]|nr:hypothetical protein [Pseudomonadota bacterium]
MTEAKEDAMEQRLRWMEENVNGAYNAKHPEGHERAEYHCTNSGTCIIVCCYINALGKVLLKGGPPKKGPSGYRRRDFERFQTFLQCCMSDFLNESDAMTLPPTPKRKSGGDEWLYEVFRCGFVHGYPGANVAWGRNPGLNRYWFHNHGRLTLNIDELVRGFHRGIVEFRGLVAADAELRSRFLEYIVAD